MTFLCEADVVEGLESIAQDEVKRTASHDATVVCRGLLQFTASTHIRKLLELKTVLSIYLVQHFPIPRPKALLGDQHLRALLAQIRTVLDLKPNAYHTFMLGAAGSNSAVMTRLKAEVSRHTGLREVSEEGELLIRIRPTPNCRLPTSNARWESEVGSRDERGWDVLVRLSPKPLATRDWRVCHIDGSLQATVAHAMALLTQPESDDVYLNLCCGSGTLLIERALAGPAQKLIGCDIDPKALACANENFAAWRATMGGRKTRPYDTAYELHEWDATRVPLPDASVDALTADLPFGHRVGSHGDNVTLHPAILKEAARVARPGARFVVITAEVKLMEAALTSAHSQWESEKSLRVNLGGLKPEIFVLRRKE